MDRLSRYLLRLFWAEALALFGVAAFMVFLTQCLRLFDGIAVKGQNLGTLFGQALLGMPAIITVFLYVCLGIGLGRALRSLQERSELQVVHVSGLVPALIQATGLYALLGTLGVLALSHIIDPWCLSVVNTWQSSIAADLVSRSMIPHKFVDAVDGVSMIIGSRDSEGNITDFFADDHRDPKDRQTYISKTAIIVRDDQGFVLRMQNGTIQYMKEDGRFSQVTFNRYDLALDQLTESTPAEDTLGAVSSLQLIGSRDPAASTALIRRTGEGLRVIAMCVLVAALAAFPTGRRRRFEVPIEIVVVAAAFIERGISSNIGSTGPAVIGVGSLLLFVIGLLVLARRLRFFQPVRIRRRQVA